MELRRVGRRTGLGLVVALSLVTCQVQESAPRVPSREEALGLLDRAVRFAQAGDFAGLCGLGGGSCEEVLETAGRESVPAEAPTVAGDVVIESRHRAGRGTSVGGRMLVLCGTDGRGRSYRTEMLVFFEQTTVKAIEPVYWSGSSIGTTGAPTTATQPPASNVPIACT